MIHLFITEFLRHRTRALLAALAHMALLVFVGAGGDVNANPTFALWWAACMVAAASFGILQMNAHKRTNHWIYLLQRPLAPWKLAMALAGAGCALLLIALVLPFVLNLARRQLTQANGYELRHYLQLGQVIPAILLAYVYACFCALYTHKFKFIGFILFIGLIANQVNFGVYTALGLLAPMTLVCFYTWFKPDLGKGATNPLFIVLSELPLQFGMFWLVINIYGALLQVSWSLFQNGPFQNPPPDSVAALQLKDGRELMLAALEGNASIDAAYYRKQIDLGDAVAVTLPANRSFPERNQRPSLDNGLVLTDPRVAAEWRFSHTAMLFKGVDTASDTVLGWLSPEGFVTELTDSVPRFASVPWVTANRFILDDTAIYQLDWEQRALREKFTLASMEQPGFENASAATRERFSDSLGIHANVVTLLSNRNLYLFRSKQLNAFAGSLALETRLPMPLTGGIGRTNVYVMELIDGYLVAELEGVFPDVTEGHFATFEGARLSLYKTGAAEENVLLASRSLPSGYGMGLIYEGFVLAPGFRLLNDLVYGLVYDLDKEATLPLLYHRFPPVVLLLAFCSMLLSGVVVSHLLKPLALPRAAKLAWVAICALSGWIGLASFYLGTYRGALSMQIKMGESHGQAPQKPETRHA